MMQIRSKLKYLNNIAYLLGDVQPLNLPLDLYYYYILEIYYLLVVDHCEKSTGPSAPS